MTPAKRRQCASEERLYKLQCQGAIGHAGEHWAYDQGGHYITWYNTRHHGRKARPMDIACSRCPPGGVGWVSPLDKAHEHFLTLWVYRQRLANGTENTELVDPKYADERTQTEWHEKMKNEG